MGHFVTAPSRVVNSSALAVSKFLLLSLSARTLRAAASIVAKALLNFFCPKTLMLLPSKPSAFFWPGCCRVRALTAATRSKACKCALVGPDVVPHTEPYKRSSGASKVCVAWIDYSRLAVELSMLWRTGWSPSIALTLLGLSETRPFPFLNEKSPSYFSSSSSRAISYRLRFCFAYIMALAVAMRLLSSLLTLLLTSFFRRLVVW